MLPLFFSLCFSVNQDAVGCEVTSDQLHTTEDHGRFSSGTRNRHHIADIEEPVSITVKLELGAVQSVG
jgi:hypothetical protein